MRVNLISKSRVRWPPALPIKSASWPYQLTPSLTVPNYSSSLINRGSLTMQGWWMCCSLHRTIAVSANESLVKVGYRQRGNSCITDLVIDSTGSKGTWKVRKLGTKKRCIWRKLHLAVNYVAHDIGGADRSCPWCWGVLKRMPAIKFRWHK